MHASSKFDRLPSPTVLILFSMLDQELHLFTSTSVRMSLTRDSVLDKGCKATWNRA